MPTYLAHLTPNGIPVGLWEEGGASFYLPGYPEIESRGKARMEFRNPEEPWSEICYDYSNSSSPMSSWATVEADSTDLEVALRQVRASVQSPEEAEFEKRLTPKGKSRPSPTVAASAPPPSEQGDDLLTLAQQLLDRARNT